MKDETCKCSENKKAEESCCCQEKAEENISNEVAEQEKESCCCGSDKTMQDKETESCCCNSHDNKKHNHSADEKQSYSSCCAPPAKHNHKKGEESCGCCGEKKSENKYVPWIILAISLASVIVSFINPFKNFENGLKYVDFGWIAVILCGFPIMSAAAKNLAKGKVTSGLLISVSIIACIVLEILTYTNVLPSHGDGHGHSNIFAAAEVAFLMKLGGLIEDLTVSKARSGISRLMELTPVTAKYMVNGEIIEKPVSEVKIGDRVVVLPNDIISVDGKIISGETAIDESVMTGESVPVDKAVGDSVFGGTLNKTGALEIEVTKTSDEMAVNKLRELVEEAEGKKAPISRTADKWAKIIVPSAIVLALVIFLLTYFAFPSSKGDIAEAVLRGVTMLVVFCPCALALATPTAVAAGLGAGTKHGVLIKSGEALEELAKVKTVAFDKTGTLTTGSLSVDEVVAYNVDEKTLKQYAGAAESLSEHPLAKAVVTAFKNDVTFPETSLTKSLVGTGVEAQIGNDKIMCVKWQYLDQIGVKKDFAVVDFDRLASRGKTVVAVTKNNELIGLIAISDTIKDGARECVEELHSMGINTVMLTGDNKLVAAPVTEKTGVKQYFAELLPEEKLQQIEILKQANMGANGKAEKVCMVGDGVNDAPALAAADCSIAMGALGSDIAIETADIALMNSDIKNVAKTVKFSKKVLTTIKANIILSMGINILATILNALGFLNPMLGALIHNASSVIVVIHSATLLSRFKKKEKVKA